MEERDVLAPDLVLVPDVPDLVVCLPRNSSSCCARCKKSESIFFY